MNFDKDARIARLQKQLNRIDPVVYRRSKPAYRLRIEKPQRDIVRDVAVAVLWINIIAAVFFMFMYATASPEGFWL